MAGCRRFPGRRGLGLVVSLGLLRFDVQGTVCNVDGGMDARGQAAMEAVAREYTGLVLAGRVGDRLGLMTDAARAAVEHAGTGQQMQTLMHQLGPFTPPKLDHFYHVVGAGLGGVSRTQCMAAGGKDWVSVQTLPGREQAYVLFSTNAHSGDGWALSEWLVREGGVWRVQNFAIMRAAAAGHDAADLLTLARRERDAGHRFNATMLYLGAQSLVNRGPVLRLALAQTIDQDEQAYPMASELSGKPPFAWGLNGNVYSVGHVIIRAVDGKLGLSFDLPQKDWSGSRGRRSGQPRVPDRLRRGASGHGEGLPHSRGARAQAGQERRLGHGVERRERLPAETGALITNYPPPFLRGRGERSERRGKSEVPPPALRATSPVRTGEDSSSVNQACGKLTASILLPSRSKMKAPK